MRLTRRATLAGVTALASGVGTPGATDGPDPPGDGPVDAADSSAGTEPGLAVDIVVASDSVTARETATVEYAVENTGGEAVTETLALLAEGVRVDSRELSLAPGGTEIGRFEYTVGLDDGPKVTLAVAGGRATATTSVAVTEPSPAAFAVGVVSNTQTVTAGGAATVVYRVENTGERAGSRTVEVLVDGDPVEDRQVILDPGAATTETVSYPITAADAPAREIVVRSGDSEVSETVVVEEGGPPSVAVSLDNPEVFVESTGEVGLTATVTNSGEQRATRTVSLELDGVERASESVSLDGGAAETVTFGGIESPDPGEHELVVDSGDSAVAGTLVVSDPVADLELAVDGEPAAGEAVPLAVSATRASGATDDVTRAATVSVASGGVVVDGRALEAVFPGPAEVTATLDGETATAALEVAEAAVFAVDIDAADLTVAAWESVEVPVAVTNSGERAGEATVTVDGDGFEAVTRQLSLDAGAETGLVVSLDPTDPEPGRTAVTATAGDDTDDLSVTVESLLGAGGADAGGTPAGGADSADGTDETGDSADDDGPGLGPAAGLAGLAALAGLLARRVRGDGDTT